MRFINRKTMRMIQERVAKRECLRLTLALIFAIFYTNRNNFTLLSNITFTVIGLFNGNVTGQSYKISVIISFVIKINCNIHNVTSFNHFL